MTAASGRSRTAQAPPNTPASVWARSSRPSTLRPLMARLRSSSGSNAAALERAWRSRLWSQMMGGRRGGRRLGTWAERTSPPAGGSLAEPRPAPRRTERDAAALENKKPISLWILASRLRSIPLRTRPQAAGSASESFDFASSEPAPSQSRAAARRATRTSLRRFLHLGRRRGDRLGLAAAQALVHHRERRVHLRVDDLVRVPGEARDQPALDFLRVVPEQAQGVC